MNWIEITPETELPKEDIICGWYSHNSFSCELGIVERIGEQVKVITKVGDVFGNPTHYCIITPPEL